MYLRVIKGREVWVGYSNIMRYLFLPSPLCRHFVSSHKACKVARRPLPLYSPPIPFKYCYFFCRLNQTHFIGMEIRKNLNKCAIRGAHNSDNVYNLTHFHSFILRFLVKFIFKNWDWSTEVVHGLGTWRGPWARSTGIVLRPGVHVLYLSQIYIFSVCKSNFHAFSLFIGRFMMQTFNVTQQPAVIVFNSQGGCDKNLNNFGNGIYDRLYKIYEQTFRGI